MSERRPYVLSIAGFDPSGGAGVLADVKTFEQCGAYGMGVVSALTYQNDISFEKVEWMSYEQIVGQVEVLRKRFHFDCIKIGLIRDLEILHRLLVYLSNTFSAPRIVWDPIIQASAGYRFHDSIDESLLNEICGRLFLITPNIPEAMKLGRHDDARKNMKERSEFCSVYLKGGHRDEKKGTDILFLRKGSEISFSSDGVQVSPKHGSGCVLSAAITASLAKNSSLENACKEAKEYITGFLMSNASLLGYHSEIKIMEHE